MSYICPACTANAHSRCRQKNCECTHAWPSHVDVTANRHGGDEMSVAAHESVKADKGRQRNAIKEFIGKMGTYGATCEEVATALGVRTQSCSARYTELKAEGAIKPAGTRPTTSGRSARVWVLS